MTIAIVGGGFSGILVAANLLRQARARSGPPLRIVLVERNQGFEAGPAYRTCSPRHLLNVPAGRMSAFPDDGTHFLSWLRRSLPAVGADAYVPRSLYREYLRAILDEARDASAGEASFSWLAEEAVDIEESPSGDGVRVHLSDGTTLAANTAVLAVGNLLPAHPPVAESHFYESPFYVRDPWRSLPLDVDADDPVLLIGSGLTMLDYALALDEQGHRGSVIAVSRRGLTPQSHLEAARPDGLDDATRRTLVESWLRDASVECQRTARGIVRTVRTVVLQAAERGIDWRDVVAVLRNRTSSLWQACAPIERARFLRHIRPYWEVARHRAAPEAAERLAALRSSGRLTIHAAQIKHFLDDDWGVSVVLRPRGSAARVVVRAAKVVNCTGPETRVERADHPLLRSLIGRGLLRLDPLGVGVETADDGIAIRADGSECRRLLVVGALNRGRLWESTAVEELRVQASSTAAWLAANTHAMRSRAAVAA